MKHQPNEDKAMKGPSRTGGSASTTPAPDPHPDPAPQPTEPSQPPTPQAA